MTKYIYCYDPIVQDVTSRQMSALNTLMYSLFKEAIITIKSYNKKHPKNTLNIPNDLHELEALTTSLNDSKTIKKDNEIMHIISMGQSISGDKAHPTEVKILTLFSFI